ncbi:MAG: hypothetical protein Q4C47_08565, partial [Planctomycetia bacterium]|nr:hypothetical protein [Planctomycetia bacterium]
MRRFRFSFSGGIAAWRNAGKSGKSGRRKKSAGPSRLRRRLLCESLESRQLLSITTLSGTAITDTDYYRVDRSADGGNNWETTGYTANASYTDGDLPDGVTDTTYDYRVYAVNDGITTQVAESGVVKNVTSTDRLTVESVSVSDTASSVTFRLSEAMDDDTFFTGTQGLITILSPDGSVSRASEDEISISSDYLSITWTPSTSLTSGTYTLYLDCNMVDRATGTGRLSGGTGGLENDVSELTAESSSLTLRDSDGVTVYSTAILRTDWSGDTGSDLLLGVQDTVNGNQVGMILVYENSGSPDSAEYTAANAYYIQYGGSPLTVSDEITSLSLADYNEDGVDDLWVGLENGSIQIYQRKKSSTSLVPEFESVTTLTPSTTLGDDVTIAVAESTVLFAGNGNGSLYSLTYEDGVWITQPLYVDGEAVVI